MAKPQIDLADIVVPVSPPPLPSSNAWLWGLAALAVIVVGAGLLWRWRRRTMQRELLRIVRAVGQQQHAPAVLAAQLDNWSRRYFHLSRIESRHCPDGIGNPLWESWVATLQHIRFDAPHAAHFAELNTLCRTAQSWLRR